MRKYAVILAALLAIVAVPAMAQISGFNNYHYNQNMNCSDCHSMHASAHNNLTDGSAIVDPNTTTGTAINPYYPAPNAGPGREYLLKADDVCASCHDGKTFAPDVIGDNTNPYVRSAGGTRDLVTPTGGGHAMGSLVRPPGYNGAAVNNYFQTGALECYSCHSPHGGAAFRNLGPYAMRSAIGAGPLANVLPTVAKQNTGMNTAADVTINVDGTVNRTWGSNLQNYYARNLITYTRNATPIVFAGTNSSNRMDHFCGVCHGNFHGGEITNANVGDGTAFVRHPTSIVTLASVPTTVGSPISRANLKVYQVTDTPTFTTDSPGCMTCHKAHGNGNPFGLIYPGFAAPDTTEEGAGVYKSLCKSCHSMGGTTMN